MTIKAMDTHFAGHWFRSRLEARWAVFMEALQLKWQYEPAGFNLPSGSYLPDFFLTIHPSMLGEGHPEGSGYWVEIKPDKEPTRKELSLLQEVAEETRHNAFLVAGRPWPGKFRVWKACNNGSSFNRGRSPSDEPHLAAPSEWRLCDRDYDMGFSVDPRDAFRRAATARFEHGALPLGWEGVEVVK